MLNRNLTSLVSKAVTQYTVFTFCVLGLALPTTAQTLAQTSSPAPASPLPNSASQLQQAPLTGASTSPSPAQTNQPDSLEDKLWEQAREYNKSLLETVFLALLSTVAAISIGVLALNYFEKILTREQDREYLSNQLEKMLDEKTDEIKQNLWTWTDLQLNSIDVRLRWMEYRVSVLSAQHLETAGYFQRPAAIIERIHAVQVLQNFQNSSQGAAVLRCLKYELEAIDNLLEKFKLERARVAQTPRGRDKKLLPSLAQDDIDTAQHVIASLENEYQIQVHNIRKHLDELTLSSNSNN